jgi:hypothetical protein
LHQGYPSHLQSQCLKQYHADAVNCRGFDGGWVCGRVKTVFDDGVVATFRRRVHLACHGVLIVEEAESADQPNTSIWVDADIEGTYAANPLKGVLCLPLQGCLCHVLHQFPQLLLPKLHFFLATGCDFAIQGEDEGLVLNLHGEGGYSLALQVIPMEILLDAAAKLSDMFGLLYAQWHEEVPLGE